LLFFLGDKMRKNHYLLQTALSSNAFLVYNVFSNSFLLLNKDQRECFNSQWSDLAENNPSLYNKLLADYFIVPDDFNEFEIIRGIKKQMQHDDSMYQIMINTTLDCNLNCWYCYENRILGSKLTNSVIDAIKKNINFEYNEKSFKTLKVSFFGGEPLLCFSGMIKILDYARAFCEKNAVSLIVDLTTNATLITRHHIDYLKEFQSMFQITLDGNRETHNNIKRDTSDPSVDTYQKTLEALQLIDTYIPNRYVAVRINFDNETLSKIDEIIHDIEFLDRKKTYVILKKVWQIPTAEICKDLLFTAIQAFFDKNFLLDYYIMPKGYLCFAERRRESLFNYDGRIFKCSTISSFDDQNTMGKLDFGTGKIQWDQPKITDWLSDIIQDNCKECKWFPACLGPCNKQLIAYKGKSICTFDSMNMNTREYLLYSFKYHLLKEKLNQM